MGGPNRKITCNMTSSETFKRGDFLWDKNILEWKLRNLIGAWVNALTGCCYRGELEPRTNVFKICVKFYCGGAMKKLL